MKFCTRCGTPNDDNALFCKECGAQLPMTGIPSAPQQNVSQSPPQQTPYQYPYGMQQHPNVISPLQSNPSSNNTGNAGFSNQGQQFGQEKILFYHPGAMFLKLDGNAFKKPHYEGTIYITERNFMFFTRMKGGKSNTPKGAVAKDILLSLALPVVAPSPKIARKGRSNVKVEEINEYLNSDGSFIINLSNISSISAGAATMLKPSFIKISTKVPVTPHGTSVSGYNAEFSFLPPGYIGAAYLKKEEAEYLNTTIAGLVGK